MKTNEECRTTLTNEERQKLCEWLRDRSYLPNTLCKQAADEIERLAALVQSGPDASAGLIEATQSVQEIAHDFARDIAANCDNDVAAIATLIERAIFRARAADRSGE